jgi:D-glycero-D-manno-heptose 1,7-bisphosphate phosphatase
MVKAIFLDRDGTINELVHGRENPKHVCPWYFAEFNYIDGVEEAIKGFRALGFSLHVVTNQPDVDDGYTTEDTMNTIHDCIKADLKVDTIQTARTRSTEEYKPNPGMLNKIIKEWHVSKERSWMIGDTWRDVVAGNRAGVKTIYLGDIYSAPEEWLHIKPDFYAKNLLEAVNIIQQNVGGQ